MSEMVDRVAKAIAAEFDVDMETADNSTFMSIIAAARAAVEAMREPTEAMLDAAVADGCNDPSFGAHEASHCWQAMIGAALDP